MSDKNKFPNKTIKSNLLYTKLANVFNFRLFKTPKNKHKRLMILWIVTNKHMSFFQKIRKIYLLVYCQLKRRHLLFYPKIFSVVVLEFRSQTFSDKLLYIERLRKKGYKVQLKISIKEKVLLNQSQEFSLALTRLEEQSIQYSLSLFL